MPEVITFHALDLSGETNLKLYLRKDDGSLLNAGGDAFTEVGTGVFQATLGESRVGFGTLLAAVCDGTESADNSVNEDFLYESESVIGQKRYAELNTGSLLAALGLEAGNLDEQLAAILAASGGALTTEQNALLVSIAQWAARNNGGPMHYTGNVGDGGVLELTVGDDHETVMENDLPIVVKDPGGLFQAKLVASGSTLSWSAGQDGVGGLITGTVTAPTYDSGTELTTIVVQVPNCAAAGNITAPYRWQLKRTSGGKIKTELQGTLRLNADMS